MRILLALTYYRPHVSGLTMYARRTAEALVKAGHEVTVLTSRYDRALPPAELRGGVSVVRCAVTARVGKGVIMPGYGRHVAAQMRRHDVVVVNYPITPPEGEALVHHARRCHVPVLAIYQCDIELPPSLLRGPLQAWIQKTGKRLLTHAERVAVLSSGYAETSPLVRPHLGKCVELPPPARLQPADRDAVRAFRARFAPDADVVVGMAARVAAEKGFEYLLAAGPRLSDELGRVRLLITGDRREALGERSYGRMIADLFESSKLRPTFVGRLHDDEMAAFFGACDVTVLPSVNRTESYGLVQVESMLCGTPVVASDRPGIRDPVARSGLGLLVSSRDSNALAEAVVRAVRERESLRRPRNEVRRIFNINAFPASWCNLLEEVAGTAPSPARPPARYTEWMRHHVNEIPPFRAMVRGAETLLIRQRGRLQAPILDLGCGDGMFAGLTLPTPVAHGLDPDAGALAFASRSGVYDALMQASGGRIPLDEESCSTVVANSVLEHIPELDATLAEVHRVLRRGGRLVLTAPSHRFAEGLGLALLLERAGCSAWARRYRAWFNAISRHHHLLSAAAWKERLENQGFTVIDAAYYLSPRAMFWFDLLHYISIPCLLSRRVLGRWHLFGRPMFTAAWTKFLSRLAGPHALEEGACVFALAEK